MSKMFFTFKWGKSTWITQDDLKQILLKYYTKEEVDEILKKYATNEEVAAELVNYAKLSDLNKYVTVEHFEDILNDLVTHEELGTEVDNINNKFSEVDNEIENLESLITDNTNQINTNTSNITNTKNLLDTVVEQIKQAKIVVIKGNYSATETYKQGDIVVNRDVNDTSLYLSLQDSNTGHALTEEDWWKNLGSTTDVNLDDYYNRTQVDSLITDLQTTMVQRDTQLQNNIDTLSNNVVKLTDNQTIRGNKTFSGTTTLGATTVDSSGGLTVKTGSSSVNLKASGSNLQVGDSNVALQTWVTSQLPNTSNFMTTNTTQTVSAVKTFSEGIKVGSSGTITIDELNTTKNLGVTVGNKTYYFNPNGTESANDIANKDYVDTKVGSSNIQTKTVYLNAYDNNVVQYGACTVNCNLGVDLTKAKWWTYSILQPGAMDTKIGYYGWDIQCIKAWSNGWIDFNAGRWRSGTSKFPANVFAVQFVWEM